MRHRPLVYSLVALSILGGMGCDSRTPMAKSWSDSIREMQVQPIFPPREDVQVGDLFQARSVGTHYVRVSLGGKEVTKWVEASEMDRFLPIPVVVESFGVAGQLKSYYAERMEFPHTGTGSRRSPEPPSANDLALANSVKLRTEKQAAYDAVCPTSSIERISFESTFTRREALAGDQLAVTERKAKLQLELDGLKGNTEADSIVSLTANKLMAEKALETAIEKEKARKVAYEQEMGREPKDDGKRASLKVQYDKAVKALKASQSLRDSAAEILAAAESRKVELETLITALETQKGELDKTKLELDKEAAKDGYGGKADAYRALLVAIKEHDRISSTVQEYPVEYVSSGLFSDRMLNRLPSVYFPEFSFTSFSQSDIAALAPLKAIVGGFTLSTQSSLTGSIKIRDACSYGLPSQRLLTIVDTEIARRATALKNLRVSKDEELTLVTEVYLARALEVSISSAHGTAGGITIDATAYFQALSGVGADRVTAAVQAVKDRNKGEVPDQIPASSVSAEDLAVYLSTRSKGVAANGIPGITVQGVSANSQGIVLNLRFSRPVAIGVRGITWKGPFDRDRPFTDHLRTGYYVSEGTTPMIIQQDRMNARMTQE
jgi:hypothetical protein